MALVSRSGGVGESLSYQPAPAAAPGNRPIPRAGARDAPTSTQGALAASRPWALGYNPFGVKTPRPTGTTRPTLPIRPSVVARGIAPAVCVASEAVLAFGQEFTPARRT